MNTVTIGAQRYTPLAAWINETRDKRGMSERKLAMALGWSARLGVVGGNGENMRVIEDPTVAEGFAVDTDPDGEVTLRVRVGTVITDERLLYLAVLLAPFAASMTRAAAKVIQIV